MNVYQKIEDKPKILAELEDLIQKKCVDTDIIPYLNRINALPRFVTTFSCSGHPINPVDHIVSSDIDLTNYAGVSNGYVTIIYEGSSFDLLKLFPDFPHIENRIETIGGHEITGFCDIKLWQKLHDKKHIEVENYNPHYVYFCFENLEQLDDIVSRLENINGS